VSFYAPKNKYEPEPEEVFDFHGYTTSMCKHVLEDVIEAGEYSHIRIIVGKGLNSPNGPVLPDFIRNFLTEKDIRFSQSKIQNGGEGALEVFFDKEK
jgi:DNA-nicking Smr family endonuclease